MERTPLVHLHRKKGKDGGGSGLWGTRISPGLPALLLVIPMLCWLTPSWAATPCALSFAPEESVALRDKLLQKGLPPAYLNSVLANPPLCKIDVVVRLNSINQESAAIYKKFLKPDTLRSARAFWRRERTLLTRMERRYQIPQQIMVAMLLVESRFGEMGKSYRIIDVYASLVSAAAPAHLRSHYRRLKKKHPNLTLSHLEARLRKKARWAYEELVALLFIGLHEGQDVSRWKGSYAGAFGIPQFLPTSYFRWAVDGDGDGKVNLFALPDSLASLSAYLVNHGWHPSADRQSKRRALWHYNRSRHYVDSIFALATAIEAKSIPPPS